MRIYRSGKIGEKSGPISFVAPVSFPRTLSECEFSKVFLIIKVRHRDIQPPNKRFLFSDLGYHTNGPCGPPYSEQVGTRWFQRLSSAPSILIRSEQVDHRVPRRFLEILCQGFIIFFINFSYVYVSSLNLAIYGREMKITIHRVCNRQLKIINQRKFPELIK